MDDARESVNAISTTSASERLPRKHGRRSTTGNWRRKSGRRIRRSVLLRCSLRRQSGRSTGRRHCPTVVPIPIDLGRPVPPTPPFVSAPCIRALPPKEVSIPARSWPPTGSHTLKVASSLSRRNKASGKTLLNGHPRGLCGSRVPSGFRPFMGPSGKHNPGGQRLATARSTLPASSHQLCFILADHAQWAARL
jgi:hypothetical protein